jgi:hypothetical protein
MWAHPMGGVLIRIGSEAEFTYYYVIDKVPTYLILLNKVQKMAFHYCIIGM